MTGEVKMVGVIEDHTVREEATSARRSQIVSLAWTRC
jgi:hypothetical protein